MRAAIAILLIMLLAGCATTKSDNIKTRAKGDSSASVRVGVIQTYDETGEHVINVCGTVKAPCEESVSVGGEGSSEAWETFWKAFEVIAIVAGLAFGR